MTRDNNPQPAGGQTSLDGRAIGQLETLTGARKGPHYHPEQIVPYACNVESVCQNRDRYRMGQGKEVRQVTLF